MPSPQDTKAFLLTIVSGIILVVVGFVAANISYGIGNYVLTQLNNSISGGIGTPLIQSSSMSVLGTALIIAGIVLVIVAISVMIRSLLEITT